MQVYVTRAIPAAGLGLIRDALARSGGTLEVWPEDRPVPRDILMDKVAGAAGVLSMLTDRIDAALLDAAGSQLRVVSQMAVGYDNVDIAAATARGVRVGHTPDVLTEATADMALALLLAAARRIGEGERYVRARRWQTWSPDLLLGAEVHGATLGIVGFGRIGQAVARRASGFGMRVLYYSRNRHPGPEAALGATFASFETLLAGSDFVSLHCALTEDTRGLMGPRQFSLMKTTAILINTARGAVVEQPALFQALAGRIIAAAALDVTDPEPIASDDPLLNLENVIVVPHIGSATEATRDKMAVMAAENLVAGLAGQRLPNCVNPSVYAMPAAELPKGGR